MRLIGILALVLAANFAFAAVQSGEYTLSNGGEFGMILSTGETKDSYETSFENMDIVVEPWDAPAWCANIIKLQQAFDSVESVPTSGYSDEGLDYQNCDYVTEGVYALKTRDNKYAVVEVTATAHSEVEMGYENSLTFRYKLQTDGSPNFVEAEPEEDTGGDGAETGDEDTGTGDDSAETGDEDTYGVQCESDEDCMELNAGNACMQGVCGYVAQPYGDGESQRSDELGGNAPYDDSNYDQTRPVCETMAILLVGAIGLAIYARN